MFVVIRKYKKMSDIEEVARRATTGLGPMLKQAPSFRGCHVFGDGQGGGGSISLFDSREAAQARHDKALAWVKDNLADLSDGRAPEVTIGEVLGSVTGSGCGSLPRHVRKGAGGTAGSGIISDCPRLAAVGRIPVAAVLFPVRPPARLEDGTRRGIERLHGYRM